MQEKIQKNSPVKQRILQFADNLGVSKRNFYSTIGVSRGTLESKTGITEDIMAKFIATYPDVSIEWLLTGKGEMLKSEPEAATPYIYKDASPPMGAPPPEQQPTANSELIEKICQLSAENALLRRDVEVLRNENEDLKNNRPKPASVPYDFDRPPAPSLVAEPEEAEYK